MPRTSIQFASAIITGVLLIGCTGGGSGGGGTASIAIDSQSPDPVVLEIPIAYVKRALPEDLDDFEGDLRDPLAFNPGAQLLVRDRSSNLADEVDLTPRIAAIVAEEEGVAEEELAIDIKNLNTSFSGEMLVFAARVVPEPVNNNLELTTWNLWTYNFAEDELGYLIPTRGKRNEGIEVGGGQDVMPHFLTDDRVVFSSSRQVTTQSRQLNEGRPQIFSALAESGNVPATVLHIYDPESDTFEQISFNQSHDLNPSVLSSGEIIFSRWNNAVGNNQLSLYRVNPSGRQLSLVYGQHSSDSGTPGSTVQFTQVREMQDGRVLALIRPFNSDTLGGNIVIIDKDAFVENDQPIWANQGSGTDDAQTPLTDTEIRTDDMISAGGQFSAAFPLNDGTNRILVSWSQCRVEDGNGLFVACSIGPEDAPTAPPLYGLWVYDADARTQQIVVTPEEGFMLTDIVAGERRDFPAVIDETGFADSDLAAEDKGLIFIDNVYDFDGVDISPSGVAAQSEPGTAAYASRQRRFVRIIQPVPIPDDDIFEIPDFAFGVNGSQSMREILGYAAVEPDGSVAIKVPAASPFMISVLDANGRRVSPRHNHWLQIGSGEIQRCGGCHTRNSELPHGRLDSQPPASNPGAQTIGGAIGFPATDPSLFGTDVGQTMAEVYELRRPDGNETEFVRDLSLQLTYTDEWTDPNSALTPDPDLDYSYDPAWTDIPPGNPIIVPNLDPQLAGRIVINYIDHIQPIWERPRAPVDDGSGTGTTVDTCIGCHTSNDNTTVPAGQLDLTSLASDIDADHFRSYRELLNGDNEQWINDGGVLTDRQRQCPALDENGDPLLDADNNPIMVAQTLPVTQNMSTAGANSSGGFFRCFEVGPASCGNFQQDIGPPPADCTDDGGVIAIDDPIDHRGMLSPSELRLISEWLDIGGQYYNNPFDPRLAP